MPPLIYNEFMVEYINFFLINLALDFAIIEMCNLIFNLYVSKFEITAIVVFSCFPTILYVFYHIGFVLFIFFKIVDYMILCMLLTDRYSLRRIFDLLFVLMLSMFSFYGFAQFFVLFVKNFVKDVFKTEIKYYYDFVIVLALLLYIIALLAVMGNLAKKRALKDFLFKVSFLLFGKHIEITGFLDSGNTLYDTRTGKCVVIVSAEALSRYFSADEMENLMMSFGADIYRLECITVGGGKVTLPIIDIDEIKLCRAESGETKLCKCVIGISGEKFAENENYECLLHREFI